MVLELRVLVAPQGHRGSRVSVVNLGQPDNKVPREHRAWLDRRAKWARLVSRDQSVPLVMLATRVPRDWLERLVSPDQVVSQEQSDNKESRDPRATRVQLDPWDPQVRLVRMECREQLASRDSPDLLDQLELLVRLGPQDTLVRLDLKARREIRDNRDKLEIQDHPDLKDSREFKVLLEPQGHLGQRASKGQLVGQARLDRPEQLDFQETPDTVALQDSQDNKVRVEQPELQEAQELLDFRVTPAILDQLEILVRLVSQVSRDQRENLVLLE